MAINRPMNRHLGTEPRAISDFNGRECERAAVDRERRQEVS